MKPTTKISEFNGLRWAEVEGTTTENYAIAYATANDQRNDNRLVEVSLPKPSTDSDVLDALRVAILAKYRLPTSNGIRNEKGDQILAAE